MSVRLVTEPLHLDGTGEVVGAVQVAESLSPLENTMSAVARLLASVGAGALLVVGWPVAAAIALVPAGYLVKDWFTFRAKRGMRF